MPTPFYKYQGTGNDFVLVDDRANTFPAQPDLIARLCQRRFGIGADGLILLQNRPGYDFQMVYFNADGGQSTMCGNGARCLVHLARTLGLFTDRTTFLAPDGPHEAFVQDDLVHLRMNDVASVVRHQAYDFVDTGSPHAVVFVPDVDAHDVVAEGRALRHAPAFSPGGTNANFVTQLPNGCLSVRTYERGVEDETYSCGTGVTACALAASRRGATSPVRVQTRGGELRVAFRPLPNGSFTDIYLTGPATLAFAGEVILG